ncbi:MAG: GNAT family N-acetyltransferase [Planctomycetes bacterium]|nr:GNAT family N-acetyltransferase [Planctomycetota bacterium]
MPTILQTPRLRLREMTPDDLDFLATMLADAEVMRWYPKQLDRIESLAWLDRQLLRYQRDGYGIWLAERRNDGTPIGQIGPVQQSATGTNEAGITYLVHRPYWRQGYATEGAAAVRDYIWNTIGQRRAITLIRPENVPSQGVARKLGMTRAEGVYQLANFDHWLFVAEQETVSN